jgi:hypothetical protein
LEEFDIVGANARFDKEKVMEELSHAEKPNAQATQSEDGAGSATAPAAPALEPHDAETGKATAYNKSVSFFDNISCESLDRGNEKDKQRQTYAEQRKLDAETFGLSLRGGYRHHHHHSHNNPAQQQTGAAANSSAPAAGNPPHRRPQQHRAGPPHSPNRVFRPVQNSNKTAAYTATTTTTTDGKENGTTGPKK